MTTTGIILAAGTSERLGRPKQNLPLGDTSVLGWVVRNAEASRLDRIVVVLGGAATEARVGLELSRSVLAYNDAYQEGCARSILAGIEVAGDTDAVMLLLGDMPGVETRVIDALLDAWRIHPTFGAIASYRGELGHPLLLSSEAFAALRALHGDKAVWKLVDREPPERIPRVPIDRPLPRDIDTWEDYLVICAAWGYQPPADVAAQAV